MSAGHGHSRRNMHRPRDLDKLRKQGGFPELWKRWERIDVDHDIPDLAGYNVAGTVRYFDRDFFHALLDPKYAEHLGIGPIDTGLKPDDTVDCIAEHEGVEKTILDSDNPIDTYLEAHELATCAEHEKVRSLGGKPYRYEDGLEKAIAWCEKKHIANPPTDLACAPYLDEEDKEDKRALEAFRKAGVEDANKFAKHKVGYQASTSGEQCSGCAHWLDDRGQELSRCEIVCGLVRNDRVCKRFEGLSATDGESRHQGDDQEAPAGGDNATTQG